MIEVRALTKRYGPKVAVDALSFSAPPGCLTGFLGPNGAGKSTTLRAVLGLVAPTSGCALVRGRPYRALRRPLCEVGAVLDASAVDGRRSARDHLLCLAASNGIPAARVAAVLGQTGLTAAARKAVGTFSLGMKQRLGIAAALLGDPGVLILDEPVNGLDLEGVLWIREWTRALAAEGRTVLVSSHLMGEMERTADRLVIIARGRLIAETSVAELRQRFPGDVLVRSPRHPDLAAALRAAGASVAGDPTGGLAVTGLGVAEIGGLAAVRGIALHEVTPRHRSLEEAYLELTGDALEYRGGSPGRQEA